MRAFDLCSGIGGFRIGADLSSLGDNFNFVAYSDSDPYANKAYQAIFDTTREISLGDIQTHTRFPEEYGISGLLPENIKRDELIDKSIPNIDFLFAGFPCQPHSLMGNRKGVQDLRGNIFYDIAEILKVKQPEHFILENVKAITSVNHGLFFKEIKEILKRHLGYKLQVWQLNASDYGVPQTRRRVFFVGTKNKELSILPPPKNDLSKSKYPTTWHLLDKEVDSRYFLSDNILKTILKNEHKGYKRKAEINKIIARPVCKSMHKMHRASQDNYYSVSYINGSFNVDENNVTYNQLSESPIRRITPREALKIQSFPDSTIEKLVISGLSDTRLYMLAGNAVPPELVKSVINHMFK